MGTLIISIIATVLSIFNVISTKVCLIIIMSSMVWMFIGQKLYFRFGFLKFWYHDFLDWHTPAEESKDNHIVCKYCDKDIMQDSQGNWF